MIHYKLKLIFLQLLITIGSYASNRGAVVLKYSTSIEVLENKLIKIDTVLIQINSRIGDDYTRVSIPYSKGYKVSNLEGSVLNCNGTKIRTLSKRDIIEHSDISKISLFEDHYEKEFELKHNEYPYLLFYTYKTTIDQYIDFCHWTPVRYSVLPTLEAILSISIPKTIEFKTVNQLITQQKIDTTQTKYIHRWKSNYLAPLDNEIFSNPEQSIPSVIAYPIKFNYGVIGSMQDWKSFGNWHYRLIDHLDELTNSDKIVVGKIVAQNPDQREQIRKLYHYVQDNTRYINVSIGIGGLKPYPASYVSENKYGDCKALTNYMKALLKYAGINSIYTAIYAEDQPQEIIINYPGPQFNHVLLAVPLEEDTIWLENTSGINPFGYIGSFTQNRKALAILEKGSKLVDMPKLNEKTNQISYNMKFDFQSNGNTIVKLNNRFRGETFDRFNMLNFEVNETDKDRVIRDYMPFDNYEVMNWELKKPNRDSAFIDLKATLQLSNYIKTLGNEFYFPIYPILIPPFPNTANRKLPLAIPYPISVSDTLVYSFPSGYKVKTSLQPISIVNKYGKYNMTSFISNGELRVVKSIVIHSGKYSLDEYPNFYKFLESILAVDRMRIVIQPSN